MVIKFTKLLSILANIFVLILLLPGIAIALPEQINAQSSLIIAQVPNSYSDSDLTPLQQQRLQAIRQRRNKEIYAVLNSSQRAKIAQELHHGSKFNQALEKLSLQPEQQEMIKAILHFTNLKLKFKNNY
ncbi:MAG: hypothetical protein RMY34_21750 [Aulosira sp. DedQUE10]|nr:hypothetical protein [Aulosira sp. DedQUE10]